MKRKLMGSLIICVSVFLLSGCIRFESVDQPTSALPADIITVSIETFTQGGESRPYFGICLPDGWTIPSDAIQCAGVYNETIYYDPLVSDQQEAASPAPEGYYWWAGAGEGVQTDSGSVYAEPEIQTDSQLGLFSIDYMLGERYNGVNQDRSNYHPIGIVDEYTPRSLQASLEEYSIILNWEPPLITEGLLGYNFYRDQQMLNTNPLEDATFIDDSPHDGIIYYSVSSFYNDSTEHLTPYELPVIFGNLYVSPEGNNANNGSSFDNALQTITYAMSIIRPDSLHPQTILLSPGTYSPYTNVEQFPISIISNVSLIGGGEDITILDADNQEYSMVLEFTDAQNSAIEGLTVTNGRGGIYCGDGSSPSLTDVTVTGNLGEGVRCYLGAASLVNVTITDNSAPYSGGGISCTYSDVSLENVIISDNSAYELGGGIYCYTSDMTLANVTISGNTAENGGGIYGYYPNITFDDEDRCNIYLNYADIGNDLYSTGGSTNVIVDTFTVLSPTGFQVAGSYTFDILQGMVTQVDADLYVSPDGDNTNSGLTPEDPLKTIHYAFTKILANIQNPRTVNLLDGVYSPSINGDYFPVCMPDYVNLSGESEIGVLLDAEGLSGVMRFFGNEGTTVSNLTLTGGGPPGGMPGRPGSGINCGNSSPNLTNITITGNSAGAGFSGGGISLGFSNPSLVNVTITDNHAGFGGGVSCHGSNPVLVNVTIAGNTANWQNGGIYCRHNSHPSLVNCILWNDYPEVYYHPTFDPNEITISFTDIQGGESGIVTNGNGTVNWLEGNMDEYPLFEAGPLSDYQLSLDSPCVDAGNPDSTYNDLEDPANPGYALWPSLGTVRNDMGAYGGPGARGDEVAGIEDEENLPGQYSLWQNYPNPFNATTIISFSIPEPEQVTLTVYDLLGREVRTMVDEYRQAGIHHITFYASDLASGIYFYRVQAGNSVNSRRMVLLK
jgi:hypothetical protein